MNLPEGESLERALDLFHDHRWRENKPAMSDGQAAELLAVWEPWFFEEFTRRRQRVSVRVAPAKVDKGSQSRGRMLVGRRSGGRCEVEVPEVCKGIAREWQHRQNRSQGGTWGSENGLHSCSPCHLWIHAHPAQARDFGWTVLSYEDPAEVAVLRRNEWVILLSDGGFEPAGGGVA